jgi:hypothetical protein
MVLPESPKQAFWEELKAYEEARRMPYISSVEEIGFKSTDRRYSWGTAIANRTTCY